MASVTQVIKKTKQPRGGYVIPSSFEEIKLNDDKELCEENIHSSLVGLAVDYLTRFALNESLENSFKISIMGATLANDKKYATELLNKITGINSQSIKCACKLVGYDVFVRAGGMGYKDVRTINPDDDTIENIIIMINRSLYFYEKYGPIVKDGFTFEGGYTNKIDRGDGDFLTSDTLWDFKVSKNKPTSAHTLQLLIYYIMGKHSIHNEFSNITKLGIFNPRLNIIYLKEIKDIDKNIIEEVSDEVIGYNEKFKKVEMKETNDFKINNFDELSMAEIMKELNCTRYMVMKYYSEKNLPLYKKSNKYYINRIDLYEWIEVRKKEQQMIVTITMVLLVLMLLIMFLLIF